MVTAALGSCTSLFFQTGTTDMWNWIILCHKGLPYGSYNVYQYPWPRPTRCQPVALSSYLSCDKTFSKYWQIPIPLPHLCILLYPTLPLCIPHLYPGHSYKPVTSSNNFIYLAWKGVWSAWGGWGREGKRTWKWMTLRTNDESEHINHFLAFLDAILRWGTHSWEVRSRVYPSDCINNPLIYVTFF